MELPSNCALLAPSWLEIRGSCLCCFKSFIPAGSDVLFLVMALHYYCTQLAEILPLVLGGEILSIVFMGKKFAVR